MEERVLVKKGAEAELYRGTWMGFQAIFKKRIRKPYRNPDLDALIRNSRTSLEAKLLSEARRLGVPTPLVYFVDRECSEIIMSYIDGTPLKSAIPAMDGDTLSGAFRQAGEMVGKLHAGGVVHGDLTTSNMILRRGRLFLIDFGLGDYTPDLEARGVDIHLMRRALESSHHQISKAAYSSFIEGYSGIMGHSGGDVLERASEIRRRGRYVEGGR